MISQLRIYLGGIFACFACLVTAVPAAAQSCEPLGAGSSQIIFSDWAGPALPVFVHRPQNADQDSRIVFVMHGVKRDGDRYRDEWRELADKNNLVIVAPTFGVGDFPTTGSYNLGNIFAAKGRENSRPVWSFAAIEPLFDDIACRLGSNQTGYAMYGHSAGGQFVHRFVTFADAPRLEAAVAANSGWYTMPTLEAFPYGWGGRAAALVDWDRAAARPLTILLGTQDIDRNDPNLRRTEQADRQGLTRFARGHAFLAAARSRMGENLAGLGWQIAYAPGIGHDNAGMAAFAIPHLLRRPAGSPGLAGPHSGTVNPAELQQRTDVAAALKAISDLEADWAIRKLISLTQIPAPPFAEARRAQAFAAMLREIDGIDVRIDEVGNVIGRRKGTGGGPAVMLAAHLDTVFPAGTDVTVQQDGNRYTAPGIGDNTRGLVSLLLVAKVMADHDIKTAGDIVFVGTVGEEGAGDLRGMRHIFDSPNHGIDRAVVIDGGDMARLITDAVGSNRYRITYSGPGGHSYGAFGTVNPHHATALAISDFLASARLVAESGTKATYSVASMAGGTGINVIPISSTFEIDLRSADPNRLAALDAILRSALAATLGAENIGKVEGQGLTLAIEDLGKRPAASNAPDSALVADAVAVLAQLGVTASKQASSTDANLPMSLGIPSITISRGGINERSHSPDEYWIAQEQHLGPQAALMILLLQAGGD